ncbi:MAG: hypothetical protein FWD24_01150 [Treponema sp.]|nr:hypothetical protein [Treponema sp.]
MVSLKTIPFSEIKLGEGSIRFEKRQVKLYTSLVDKNPKNKFYKKTLFELSRQLEEDEELLKKIVVKKANAKEATAKKPAARKATAKKSTVKKVAAKKAY